ncbi:glycosyltransferase family 2 protein [bacterium]|nr:glycosyltransferase family 2 protein [bacterium]
MPKVSVIIPTYNRADFLREAINSVLKQSFKDFELIVVDDGSTDNTKKIVLDFQERDERIKYYYQKNSGGAASPKNFGIKKSSSDLIAILDSDDKWLSQKLEKQINFLEVNQGVDFIACDYFLVSKRSAKKDLVKIIRVKNVLENVLMRDYIGPGSGMIYRKKVFDVIGGFDEKLKSGQDWDMRIRLAGKFKFDFINEPLFYYFIHDGRITNTLGDDKKNDINYIFEKHGELYENNKRVLSNKLRYDGTRYTLSGETALARRFFLKSIKNNPLNFKSYFYLFFSFFGNRVYYKLNRFKTFIKNKIKK